MDDEAAILAAIAAHPAEDTPRLAYADWLDEHGRHLRAEFIRVQIELKKYEHLPSSQQQGYADLYRRQDALLTHHRRDLLGPLGDDLNQHDVVFDRGFVTELELSAGWFLTHSDAIAAMRPTPSVAVSCGSWYLHRFLDDARSDLPTSLVVQNVTDDPNLREFESGDLDRVVARVWVRLRHLGLGGCSIADGDLAPLVDSTPFPALVSLDLSGNEISDAGVLSLVTSPLWPRLRHLVLDGNPISDEGAFALADAPPTKIEYLNVRFTGIGSAGQLRLLRRKGWNVALF